METKTKIIRTFYEQTIAKTEKEKEKYKHFKEVIKALDIIIDHSKEQLAKMDKEAGQ